MNIKESTILETENLMLRIPSMDDIPFIFSATRHEGFNDGMLWNPPLTIDELTKPYHDGIQAWKDGKAYGFTIEDNSSHEFLGRISIRKTDVEHKWNIGFWTHPRHQKKGIMTEALGAVLHFGFTTLAAEVIEACYALWNKASEKVLHKNGMTFIKYIEQGFKKNGQWVEENLVAIDKTDWENPFYLSKTEQSS